MAEVKTIILKKDEYISDSKEFNKRFKEAIRSRGSIIIKAGLGAGKTQFVLRDLVEKVLLVLLEKNDVKKEGVILILSNRDALKKQMEKQYNLDSKYIELMNYQKLEADIIKGNPPLNAKIIIADECHYFFCDSTFNKNSDVSLEEYLLKKGNDVRIFISATPELFLKYIEKHHRGFFTHIFNIEKENGITSNIYYFWSEKTVEDKIDEIWRNTNDKILLFCNNTKTNDRIVKKYKDKAVSISADNKLNGQSKKEFSYISNNERLRDETRLVASTSVLNNGISIKNEIIKHIFILDFMDIDDAVQCIGRKRLVSGDHIEIYIRIPHHDALSSEQNRIQAELSVIDELKKISTYDFTKKYSRKDNRIVYVDSDEEGKMFWAVNEVLKTKLDHQNTFITKVLSDYKEYLKEITQKLGYTIEKIECIEPNQSEKLKSELIKVFSEYEGRKLYSNKNTKEKSAIVYFVEAINKCEHIEEKITWKHTPDSRRIETMITFLGLPFLFTRGIEKKRNGHRDETYWMIKNK